MSESVVPSEGWGVLHLFFHLRREYLTQPASAAQDFAVRMEVFNGQADYQALCFSVLGQKADLGLMLLGPDLKRLDAFTVELADSPLGAGLIPAASYLSMTELSEYTTTEAQETQRLVEQEGLAEGSPELEEQLAAWRTRMADYNEHRLHPKLPAKKVLSFYPMSKRRTGEDNWYALPFDERRKLMGGHARVGMTYRGRVLQLITGSTGLDDWEWGVTLLADDPKALKEIVYEMRFDEVSARYGEFGPFATGLVMEPAELMAHLNVRGA